MNKRILVAMAALAVSISMAGCGQAADQSEDPASVSVSAPVLDTSRHYLTVDDVSLQDSEVVYMDDDETSVVTMYLTVSRGNEADNTDHTWAEVNGHSIYYYEEHGIERYGVEGILQVGDESGPIPGNFGYAEFAPNCTVTIRGATSSRHPQKSYKISINKNEGYWREQRVINLNKHVYDSVRFRNKLSYDLLKTIPNAFSARTQFVHLYVKDLTTGNTQAQFEDYGLYTQVEQFNKAYLRNHGLDENGQLYKARRMEFYRYADNIKLTSDPTYDLNAFEQILEVKGNEDHSKLIAMLDDVNNLSMPIQDTFQKYFDEENYFTWMAFQILTGNEDTASQNFYLYSPQNGSKFYFIPWDNDSAWAYEQKIRYEGNCGDYNYESGISNYWGAVLHQRVLRVPEYREKLDAKMEELYEMITPEQVAEMVREYSAVTFPYMSRMPDQMYLRLSMDHMEQVLELIPQEMENRYRLYKESLSRPMPFFLGEPVSNGTEITFQWDTAYDFDNEGVTYTFELATDYLFQNMLDKQSGLVFATTTTKNLIPGQYFWRVTATNESGKTQTAMEYYVDREYNKHYGIMCINVLPDGTIQRVI